MTTTATDLERLHARLLGKRHPLNVRLPATINPDVRGVWRGLAGSYAHVGRSVETFVEHAVLMHGAKGKHAARTLTRTAAEREIAAFRSELGDIFPAPAEQPLPMVRFSQAGVQSVIGRAL